MSDRKRRTPEEIRRAIQRIEHGRPKRVAKAICRMNISTVAKEAAISAASIHNTYSDIAKVIRAKSGKDGLSVLDTERLARARLVRILCLARERLRAAERDIAALRPRMRNWLLKTRYSGPRLPSRNMVELGRVNSKVGV